MQSKKQLVHFLAGEPELILVIKKMGGRGIQNAFNMSYK